MNTIHNLRISVLLFFLLCVSGWGNLWAQNETEEVDTLSATAIPSAADSLLVEQLSALGIPLYSIILLSGKTQKSLKIVPEA